VLLQCRKSEGKDEGGERSLGVTFATKQGKTPAD